MSSRRAFLKGLALTPLVIKGMQASAVESDVQEPLGVPVEEYRDEVLPSGFRLSHDSEWSDSAVFQHIRTGDYISIPRSVIATGNLRVVLMQWEGKR